MNPVCPLLSTASGKAAAFPNPPIDVSTPEDAGEVVLSGGCFWCTEAVYRQLEGVLNVTAGYAGDSAETAHYAAVSTGTTNHAEAIRIEYDPRRLSFGAILKVFFSVAHDPTHKDRQADDVGRHYRSAIFCASEEQRRVAAAYIAALDTAGMYGLPIATTLEPLQGFFPAEADFQDYAARNPTDPYVEQKSLVKVRKAREWYADSLKNQGTN
jgi:peptide-methionine (S)-S-oxide reductase